MKLLQKIYWKWKRSEAEYEIRSAEKDVKFVTPFFVGDTLYERKKKQMDKRISKWRNNLSIADTKCKELGVT